MPYFIFLAIFMALVCPNARHSARSHQNVSTFAAPDSTSDSGGEDGHIHP